MKRSRGHAPARRAARAAVMVLIALAWVSPVTVSAARPSPVVSHAACFFSLSDGDGTWQGLRLTIGWEKIRVQRVIGELYVNEQPPSQNADWDNEYFTRRPPKGSVTFDLWPMKAWDTSTNAWVAGTFRDYHVMLEDVGTTVADLRWSSNTSVIPDC